MSNQGYGLESKQSENYCTPVCCICNIAKPITELVGTCQSCRDRISQLESSLAELQRVVQVKDEALKKAGIGIQVINVEHGNYFRCPLCRGENQDHSENCDIGNALKTTPKDLPKFIPEEEYLRVKEVLNSRIVDLSTDFMKLKTHAEAMAEACSFGNVIKRGECFNAYRKDFPK